ncbi:DUF2182 domain-containing protein [Arenicella xantha]|uniref:Putative metal-binding membrane protein n=1 Tax=Arenicella xantha TaxID=644221 RepID=A0A395JKE3_9GAMM|nr:DUF2182 domain-containing protein [Arenicella xantha]RBP51161.1 putative metal-binding membrane protein [Arenicella xantha]
MSEHIRVYRQIVTSVVGASAVAWSLLLIGWLSGGASQSTAFHADWCQTGAVARQFMMASFTQIVADIVSISNTKSWFLMLLAMMLPTLVSPIQHVYERSFKQRRARSIMLFCLGYSVVWLVAGTLIHLLVASLAVLLSQSYWLVAMGILIAFIWQCSPIKQRCLNRNHEHSELRAHGFAVDIDAVRFGLRHGFWCVGSCWALMALPLMLLQLHGLAMVAVMLLMVGESLERPSMPRWRLRGLGKLYSLAKRKTARGIR